ncbi:unnamed protein product [Diatraea saccharalis]|uniref:Uncharacterized protein n=1 Tax=Diatraea saccharalis TaxID=40085 RepID=A0A9N9QZX2_9NEOP|nr:unnamed protein product [Diatraea saccharalis]
MIDLYHCTFSDLVISFISSYNLTGNIGSTCGFVTGFSFVSLLEFIYFFTVKLYREFKNRKQRVLVVKSLDNSSLVRFEKISMYRPIYWNELAPGKRIAEKNLKLLRIKNDKSYD